MSIKTHKDFDERLSKGSLMRMVLACITSEPAKVNDIADRLKASGIERDDRSIRGALALLETEGEIVSSLIKVPVMKHQRASLKAYSLNVNRPSAMTSGAIHKFPRHTGVMNWVVTHFSGGAAA